MTRKNKTHALKTIITLCSLIAIFIGACDTFKYEPVFITPSIIPGAEYVGAEFCGECHEDEHKYFQFTDHASVSIDISEDDAAEGQAESCETCHGPGSLHIENYGDKNFIARSDSQTCFGCHLGIRAKFLLQHHHPVNEGFMECTDCHVLHGNDVRATGGQLLLGEDEKCFACHKEQRGPFVFVHDAMREGCSSCHNPHGSINEKLLIAGQTTTCIRCHWEVSFNGSLGSIGRFPHGFFSIGRGSECIDCHTAPHGSNIWRTLTR